ncbi:MAG TPA: hypothetical protein VJB91_01965 [Patescibacteria group bacterium]|nr:hypothetical protein [Patescibacteria group bacterium]
MLPYTQEDLASIFLADPPLSYKRKKILLTKIPLNKLLDQKRNALKTALMDNNIETRFLKEREKFDAKTKNDKYIKQSVRVIKLLGASTNRRTRVSTSFYSCRKKRIAV